MDADDRRRVVLVHDWLTGMRGGEKCLDSVRRRWPQAPIYTLLHDRGKLSPAIENGPIHTSFLQRIPGILDHYRYALPLMPFAMPRLPACELVLSMSHCVAKSAVPPTGTPHVCYCFTPMRYAWHMRDSYFERRGLKAKVIDRILGLIREWDRRTADRVTHFVAISGAIRERIRDCYGRESTVIYPPVDTEFYTPDYEPRDDYFLVVGAFAPYKRIDLAIEACRKMNRRLIIIGGGQDEARLRRLAGPQTQFLGRLSDADIREHYRRCRALLFPGIEDFGIVPLEANACGAPVIAIGQGGATETIPPLGESSKPCGVWFAESNAESLIDGIERFEQAEGVFTTDNLRRNAQRFRKARYEAELFGYLEAVLGGVVEQRRAA